MSRRRQSPDEPTLFDLPLADEPPPEPAVPEPQESGPSEWDPLPDEAVPVAAEAAAEPVTRPLFDDAPAPRAPAAPPAPVADPAPPAATAVHRPAPVDPEPAPDAPRPAGPSSGVPLPARLMAGFADLAVHLAVAVALLFGSRLLAVRVGAGELPALVLFLLVFSFLYTVIPLAFWGRTPGMGWAGLTARGADGDMLTFSETTRRWAAGVATVVLLALPLVLVVGGGPSLADRWSRTRTVYG